jgi:ferredoxin
MGSSILKRIRLVLAILIGLVLTIAFVDFRHLVPEKYFDYLLFLQFVPSILRFIDIEKVAATGFIIVLILTLLSGRTYCSILCPLGILQDVISRIGGKFKRKFRRFGFSKPFTILRYSILAISLIIFLLGGIYVLTLLDPYSIFGRTMTYFVKPVIILVNNLFSDVLLKFDIYTLRREAIIGTPLLAYSVPVAFLLLIGFLSFRRGRLYCNTLCPVGTLLGLISKVSLFRIKFEESKCTRCGRCALACKSSCIDFLNKSIDLSRCVDCFNCIQSCPDNALFYWLPGKREKSEEVDKGKRQFVAGSILFLLGLSSRLVKGQNVPIPIEESTVKEEKTSPVCPPGATSILNLNERCTACSLCINACPNDVIQPSTTEYGLIGIMQPRMDFHKGFCAYDCIRCTEVCPTGALLPLNLEAKKLTQIGLAIFLQDNCIVYTEKTDCGACSEHCPTKAAHMIPFEGTLVIPEVTSDICIGCGACEYACPVTPFKAIYVDGNPNHLAALKPESEGAVPKPQTDFPF